MSNNSLISSSEDYIQIDSIFSPYLGFPNCLKNAFKHMALLSWNPYRVHISHLVVMYLMSLFICNSPPSFSHATYLLKKTEHLSCKMSHILISSRILSFVLFLEVLASSQLDPQTRYSDSLFFFFPLMYVTQFWIGMLLLEINTHNMKCQRECTELCLILYH